MGQVGKKKLEGKAIKPKNIVKPDIIEPQPELKAVAKIVVKPDTLKRDSSKKSMIICINNELNFIKEEVLINERTSNYQTLLLKFKQKIEFDNY